LAPALSGAPHAAHPAAASRAPQMLQNFPDALAPQLGHFIKNPSDRKAM
jgi:hypothetical protein